MLDELKEYLRITWSDEATDHVISGVLDRAKAILNKYASQEVNYEEQVEHKQLLFDCCRYLYNDAFEDFERNFRNELIMLRAEFVAHEVTDDEEG